MRLADRLAPLHPIQVHGVLPDSLDALTDDSRKVSPGQGFVALRGATRDGHRFIEAAIAAGAGVIFCEETPPASAPAWVRFADTRAVLPELAQIVYRSPSQELEVIGVTGTNGKTTTTYMIEALGRAQGIATGVIGTISHRFPGYEETAINTTPGVLENARLLRLMANAGVRRVAMEVSSHGLDQARLDGIAFDLGIWTNLSKDHLDYHGSMEAYRAAKERLFTERFDASRAQGKHPMAILNAHDPGARALPPTVREKALWYGLEPSDTLHTFARELSWDVHGVDGEILLCGEDSARFNLPLLGRYNLLNALAAATACAALGDAPEAVIAGLAQIRDIPGRMQRFGGGGRPSVFVDYAHSPDALEKALEAVRLASAGAVWVVFGAGGDRDPTKRPDMGSVASRLADQVVITSDNPRSEPPAEIADAILSGVDEAAVSRVHVELEREAAITWAISQASPHDCVLVAGKGHEPYQILAGHTRRFDDREEVSRALDAWRQA